MSFKAARFSFQLQNCSTGSTVPSRTSSWVLFLSWSSLCDTYEIDPFINYTEPSCIKILLPCPELWDIYVARSAKRSISVPNTACIRRTVYCSKLHILKWTFCLTISILFSWIYLKHVLRTDIIELNACNIIHHYLHGYCSCFFKTSHFRTFVLPFTSHWHILSRKSHQVVALIGRSTLSSEIRFCLSGEL